MAMSMKMLAHEAYTVGWICALPKEMAPAIAMLEEIHTKLSLPSSDHNNYSLGSINGHNIVIACLPKGSVGTNDAASVAMRMSSTFPSIKFNLIVGIGGGVPSHGHDVRLGDVVVSTPTGQHGGVVQYDLGKTTQGGVFERAGALNRPPMMLLTALSNLEALHDIVNSKGSEYISDMLSRSPGLAPKYSPCDPATDILYQAEYDHPQGEDTCAKCDPSQIVKRNPRNDDEFVVHYGLIASGNQVMRDGVTRDRISKGLGGHELFRDWQKSESSRTLWVSADPKYGKSVLAKYLVDHVLTSNEFRTTCYFFFKNDFEDQKSVTSALYCILHQLFDQRFDLLSEAILEQLEITRNHITSSFSELWGALLSAANSKNAGEIVCILDAIDECEDHGRSQLARVLRELYSTRKNFNLKFLLTSRPYGEIRQDFKPLAVLGLPVIHLSGESENEMEKISREIDIFINAKVQEIRDKLNITDNDRNFLLKRLKIIPNRTYLWVYITLDLIESDIKSNMDINRYRIAEVTSYLPQKLDEEYEKILSKIRNREKARRLLQIIIAAVRPLTLHEMNIALNLEDNHQSYSSLDLESEECFRDSVRDLCGLFITIKESKIYLLHQTAKKFLVGNDQASLHPGQWKNSLQPRASHQALTDICIKLLLFVELESHPLTKDMVVSEYVKSYEFLDYSAKHWTAHLQRSQNELELNYAKMQSILRLCNTTSKRCLTWFRIYWTGTSTDFPENVTTLIVASYFGFAIVVKHLLESENNLDLNSKDSRYKRSALSWAAENGFEVVVAQLLKASQVDSVDNYHRTPLVYAVWKKNTSVIRQLVKAGARDDLEDDIGGTPLFYAIYSGQNEVVKRVFKRANAISSMDTICVELLMSAARKGHDVIIKWLLEMCKVGPDIKDWNGRTPLL
ncbi:hypothetical protein TWF703_000026 [Orbilia oligospora]|uniref:Uncharacterized protein n=1 Tax=Orbilia oligospora TaxID=2813651 RepID=A0A7C8JWL7_ORBOL|nr:hypothetical protein TWF703_000026 [Orbilia oligospora]